MFNKKLNRNIQRIVNRKFNRATRRKQNNSQNDLQVNIQTICAILSVIFSVLALCLSGTANNLSKMAYNHSMVSYNPVFDIEKVDNNIVIKNDNIENFDIYKVTIDGVERYECKIEAEKRKIELATFHFDYKKSEGTRMNLNDLKIDTDFCYQVPDYTSAKEEAIQLDSNIKAWINLYESNHGITFKFKEEVYYITIVYSNIFDYETKTICLECIVGNENEFEFIIPWTANSDNPSYKDSEAYFQFMPSPRSFGYTWKRITDWIESK